MDMSKMTDLEVAKLFGEVAIELLDRGIGFATAQNLSAKGLTTRSAMAAIGDGVDAGFHEAD